MQLDDSSEKNGAVFGLPRIAFYAFLTNDAVCNH